MSNQLVSKTSSVVQEVNKKALKVKLGAELRLVDRELETIQSSFGIQLYDAIAAESEVPSALSHITKSYEACRDLIDSKVQEQEAKFSMIDSHQSQRLRAAPPVSMKDRVLWVRDNVKTRSTDVKLKAQTLWLDREIKLAKQAFGREVFDAALEIAHADMEDLQPEAALPQEENNSVAQQIINVTSAKAEGPKQRKDDKLKQLEVLEAPTTGEETVDIDDESTDS